MLGGMLLYCNTEYRTYLLMVCVKITQIWFQYFVFAIPVLVGWNSNLLKEICAVWYQPPTEGEGDLEEGRIENKVQTIKTI